MTDQISETLRIQMPGVSFGAWGVYGVIRGMPSRDDHGWGTREPLYRADPGAPEARSTGNWKGYTEHWCLTTNGRLLLEHFSYDVDLPQRVVNETVEGDFRLMLKSEFNGPRLYVPFERGVIVLDRSRWLHEAYVVAHPNDTELRAGCHPDFPARARLWYQLGLPERRR